MRRPSNTLTLFFHKAQEARDIQHHAAFPVCPLPLSPTRPHSCCLSARHVHLSLLLAWPSRRPDWAVSPDLHPGCVSEKRNYDLFFPSLPQCPAEHTLSVGLMDSLCTDEETETRGPKSLPKVSRLVRGRAGRATRS